MDIALHKIIVTQDQTENQEPPGGVSMNVLLDPTWKQVVQPDKMVPIPKYLLRYWYGKVSASEVMLVIGVRQASFLPKVSAETNVLRKVSFNQAGRWAGLSKQRISRLLQNKNKYLDRFFHPATKSGGEGQYQVRIRIPLAPEHLAALESLIRDECIPWRAEHPGASAKAFVDHLAEAAPDAAFLNQLASVLDPDQVPDAEGLSDLLQPYFPNLTPEEKYWCLKYEDQIIQPGRNVVFTHYFINNWLPEMTSQEALSLLVLRSFCSYKKVTDEMVIASIPDAAQLLKMDRKTFKKMLEQIAAGDSMLANFTRPSQGDWPATGPFYFEVAMYDPINPVKHDAISRHKQKFTPARHLPGKMLTQEWENVDGAPEKGLLPDPSDRKNVDGSAEKSLPSAGKMFTPSVDSVDPLIKTESRISESIYTNQEQPQRIASPQQVVVVVNDWDISKILEFAGLSKNQNALKVIREIQQNSLHGEYFIARLIYAYERASVGEGRGIKAPELYTLQHYQETPSQIYLRLARRSPGELLDAYEDGFMSRLPEDERVILSTACKRGMQALIDNLAPEYYADERTEEPEEYNPPPIDMETEKAENELWENNGIQEAEEPLAPQMAVEQPRQPPSDPACPPLIVLQPPDPFAYLQNMHAQKPAEPPAVLHEIMLDTAPAEDLFPVAPGVEISAELYKTWAAAMRTIREQMRIGYSTFLAGAELVGCEIDGHLCRLRLQLPEDKRDVKRNGVVYPRFANAVEAILAEHFQTEQAELQLM